MKNGHGHFLIENQDVVNALIKNGFSCVKSHAVIQKHAVIQIFTKTKEEIERAEKAHRWYDTDCPIEFNGEYTLRDGRTVKSKGTRLVFMRGR